MLDTSGKVPFGVWIWGFRGCRGREEAEQLPASRRVNYKVLYTVHSGH